MKYKIQKPLFIHHKLINTFVHLTQQMKKKDENRNMVIMIVYVIITVESV